MKVHVLVIDTEYGTIVSCYETEEALKKYLFSFVSEYWSTLPDNAPKINTLNPQEAIEYYFDNHGQEWHVIQQCEVEK